MKISVCVSHISALKALMAVLAVFLVKAGFAYYRLVRQHRILTAVKV